MLKVNDKGTRTTPWRRSGVFIVNFEHFSHLVLVFPLLTLNMKLPDGIPIQNSVYQPLHAQGLNKSNYAYTNIEKYLRKNWVIHKN